MSLPEAPLASGVACERTYQVVVDGEAKPFLCLWYVPEPHPEGGWECRIKIIGPADRVRTRTVGGLDSTQALMLALSSVGADFVTADDPVHWFDPDDDLGLPALDIVADEVAARKARFEAKS